MPDRIRWGILGLGNIARKFAEGLQSLPDAELAAVASRSPEKSQSFGREFGAARFHDSYTALAEDPGVDAVYVATPHPMHRPNTIQCLQAGKAVLCEKPFTVNLREAEEVVAVARSEKRFLMEAMWTRFLPVVEQTRSWIAEGRIGEPRMVQADFGFRAAINEDGRLFSPKYAGGGLLDVGVYCVSFAHMVFGEAPSRVAGLADIGATGVDEQGAMVLGYSGGRLAVLSSAVRTETPQEVLIMGTSGSIRIHPPFWCGNRVTLTAQGKAPEELTLPYPGNGYTCEAAAVGGCLREGKLECETMPLEETLSIMGTLDRIRAAWGLRYPMDKE